MTMETNVEKKEEEYGKDQALLKDILAHVVNSSAVFKPQQIEDPEISEEEKKKISEALLFESPVNFLVRFGQHLKENHLDFFNTFKDTNNSYDLEFYITELKKSLGSNSKRKITRNRRFEALKRLEQAGKYFSEAEMEKRDPLLYYQLVGQYLTEGEKLAKYKRENEDCIPSFSGYLINRAEEDRLNDIRKQQEEAEDAEVLSDDDESSNISEKSVKVQRWGADWEDEEKEKKMKESCKSKKKKRPKVKLTGDERKLLLQEFKTCIFTKFLDGLDPDFDYGTVDTNPEYDCLQERTQDEEEKYFDDESSTGDICTDTGIEDY